MAQKQTPSMVGYNAAMEWLFDNRPHMMAYIASLGAPKNDLRCDRAMVVAGPDMKPRLYANDEFLQKIGPAQAAGVLVHEWRHVLLGHFSEALNPKPHWKYQIVVRDAQEATINDSVELTGYELPDDVIRGENRGGHFYGYWTTDEAYGPMEEWYLAQQPPQQDPQSDSDSTEEESDSGSEDAQQSGSGSASGSGSGSSEGSESGEAGSPSSGSEQTDPSDAEQGSDPSAKPSGSSDADSGDSPADGAQDGAKDEKGSSAESDGSSGSSEAGDEEADSSGSAGSGEQEDSEEGDAEAGDAGESAPDELEGEGSSDGCKHGGYIEDEEGDLREMTDEELEAFNEKLNEIIAGTITDNPMPDEEKPTENELDAMDQDVAEAVEPKRAASYSKAGTVASAAEEVLAGGKLHLGWLKLLQKINPDVGKDDGGMNAKASYNWARQRRTTSLIRGVHLPTPGAPRGEGIGTKHRPVALIALDFSASIDRRLAYAMKDMAQSIPEEHIEARCITFSTQAVPFDFRAEKNSVASGGTDFSCIEEEARKIQKETGEYPYVICLTDGEAWFHGYSGQGGTSAPTQIQLDTRWLWVDVLTEDDLRAFKSKGAYPQVRAQKNLSALPYDRSKL